MLGMIDCMKNNCIEETATEYKMENKPVLFDYSEASVPKLKEILPHSVDIEKIKTETTTIYIYDILNYNYPATSPSLLVSYLFFPKRNELKLIENTFSSLVVYVVKGSGEINSTKKDILFTPGDVICLPSTEKLKFLSYKDDTVLLLVDDSPLLNFLSVKPGLARFQPVIYRSYELRDFVLHSLNQENSQEKNRNGVLLSNDQMKKEGLNTISHTMWSLLNVTKANSFQKPHRHNSVALDFCVEAEENKVYTLMGKELNQDGSVKDPIKIYWKTNCMFITPPGWWHSHHNESNSNAWVFPVQDAGLHTYLRTLDIQFVN